MDEIASNEVIFGPIPPWTQNVELEIIAANGSCSNVSTNRSQRPSEYSDTTSWKKVELLLLQIHSS